MFLPGYNSETHSYVLLLCARFHIQRYLDFARPVHPGAYQSCIYSSGTNTKDALLTNTSSQYSL